MRKEPLDLENAVVWTPGSKTSNGVAIFDRDSTFREEVAAFLEATGLKPKRTSVQAPWQNGVAERWIGSASRDCFDPKLVADQLGHTVDVSLNVYAQSPVAGRAVIVNELELLVQWCSSSAQAEGCSRKSLKLKGRRE